MERLTKVRGCVVFRRGESLSRGRNRNGRDGFRKSFSKIVRACAHVAYSPCASHRAPLRMDPNTPVRYKILSPLTDQDTEVYSVLVNLH